MVFFEYVNFKYFNINKREYITEKFIYFNRGLTRNELANLPITKIYYDCNIRLRPEIKTSRITHLVITEKFREKLDNLPNNLKFIYFDGNFYPKNDYVIDSLPKTLEFLYCEDFCHRHIKVLPPKLKYLKINETNRFINNLPCSLIYLETDKKFNEPIDFLPSSLEFLIITNEFTHSLENLPPNLIHLKLGDGFADAFINHSVVLPNKLEYLDVFKCIFSKTIDFILPSSLKILVRKKPNSNFYSYYHYDFIIPDGCQVKEI